MTGKGSSEKNAPNRHATLVAFYADAKPPGLEDYVGRVQRRMTELVGDRFQQRAMNDVHATLIGLESFGQISSPDELKELRARDPERPNLVGLCAYLGVTLEENPLQIQLGGFPDRDLALMSRTQRLYTRTITANAGQVILMGWPVDKAGQPTDALDRIRRELRKFGVEHRYHKVANDRDPDLYMVIGGLDKIGAAGGDALETIRLELSQAAFRVPLLSRSLQIATYDDTNLPLNTTRVWPLAEFLS